MISVFNVMNVKANECGAPKRIVLNYCLTVGLTNVAKLYMKVVFVQAKIC